MPPAFPAGSKYELVLEGGRHGAWNERTLGRARDDRWQRK